MLGRGMMRETLVRRMIVMAVVGLLALLGLIRSVSWVLRGKQTIEVVFRDCQGIRVGSPVRLAGIDTGEVLKVELTVEARSTVPLAALGAATAARSHDQQQQVVLALQSA